MQQTNRDRQQMLSCCGQIHADDGIDPREYFAAARQRGEGRKAMQLCQQVARTLQLVLAGELDDEVLQSLEVLSVVPAPNTSQLAVRVRCRDEGFSVPSDEVCARLERAAGRLRSEVARSITRRRAPRLLFQLAGS